MPLSEAAQESAIRRLSFAAFCSAIALRMCDPLLPQLAADFSTSTGQAAHVIAYFSVAYGLMQACYGPLGDRQGKFRVITFATLASTLGALGAAFSTSLDWLVVSRVVSGATTAAIIPLSMAWIGDNIPYERRQATLARFLSGQILGMVVGQFAGGLFADTLGWRWAFLLLAAFYVAVGAFLFAELQHNRDIDRPEIAPAVAGGRLKLWTQFHNVLRMTWPRYVLLAVFLEGLLVFGAFAFVPSYLHKRFGVSLTGAGAIFAIYGLGGLSYTLVTRRLVALLGERGLALNGSALLSAAFIMFLFGPSWHWAMPASFLSGLGFYMMHNTLQTNATQMAPATRGTAVSLFASCFFLGQAAGVGIAAIIVDQAGASWLFGIAAVAVPVIGAGFAYVLRFRE